MSTYNQEADGTPASTQQYQMMSAGVERSNIDRSGELDFTLHMEQQPLHSRMCGVGEKNNRRPIDPPPAVSVVTRKGKHGSLIGFPQMEALSLVMHVTLVDQDFKPVMVQNRERQMTPLVGVTNTTLHRITLQDETSRSQIIKGVFAFTDLSVRQEGLYYLRFDLFEILGGEVFHRAECLSAQFRVYPAKTFPGMKTSTPFTDQLKKVGIRVRVSKSVRTAKTRANQVDPDVEFDVETGEQNRLQINAHSNARRHPYEIERNAQSGRHRRESEPIPYQFPPPNHSSPATNFLPPPVHSGASPSPTTPSYDRPFEHRNEYVSGWPSRDPTMYGERRDHEYVESRRTEFPRPRDTVVYGHSSYGASLPTPVTYGAMPVHTNNAYNGIRRPSPYSSPRAFRSSEPTTTRGHGITQTDVMRMHHHDKPKVHPGFNPPQETAQASHDERPNGRVYVEHQTWPPPADIPAPESTFYNNNSGIGYQGYSEGYRG